MCVCVYLYMCIYVIRVCVCMCVYIYVYRLSPHQREHPAVRTRQTKVISIPVSDMIIIYFFHHYLASPFLIIIMNSPCPFIHSFSPFHGWAKQWFSASKEASGNQSKKKKKSKKRLVNVIEICHSPCFNGGCNIC